MNEDKGRRYGIRSIRCSHAEGGCRNSMKQGVSFHGLRLCHIALGVKCDNKLAMISPQRPLALGRPFRARLPIKHRTQGAALGYHGLPLWGVDSCLFDDLRISVIGESGATLP